jgi:hypothetical protein
MQMNDTGLDNYLPFKVEVAYAFLLGSPVDSNQELFLIIFFYLAGY